MSVLVQMLLPVRDDAGKPFPRELFEQIRHELTERFGGVTSYLRAPATGLWKQSAEAPPSRDEVVLFEVMSDALDRAFWLSYRDDLEIRLGQSALVVRAIEVERL